MEIMSELDRSKHQRQDERISPREIELIKFRDNRTPLVVKLTTGEQMEGAVRWYDERAIRLVMADRSEVTVYVQAIAYYRTQS